MASVKICCDKSFYEQLYGNKLTFRRKVYFVGVEVFEESSVDRVRKLVDFYQVLATLLPMVLKH